MTKRIPEEYDEWGFEPIDKRTEQLAEDIITFWGT